jgi:hypothetical protein
MLRLLVLVLVLLNGGYYAWSQGLLRAYGFAPAQQSEPQRVAQQIQPQAVRVVASDEARGVNVASRPPECLQAGLFDEPQAAALRQLAQKTLPDGSWSLEDAADPERADVRGKQFRLPVVDDALRSRLDELQPALAGKPLVACR